jgi:hypothetical protein
MVSAGTRPDPAEHRIISDLPPGDVLHAAAAGHGQDIEGERPACRIVDPGKGTHELRHLGIRQRGVRSIRLIFPGAGRLCSRWPFQRAGLST